MGAPPPSEPRPGSWLSGREAQCLSCWSLGQRAARLPEALRRGLGVAAQGPFSAGVVTLLSDYEVCKEGDVLTGAGPRPGESPAPSHPASARGTAEGPQTPLTALTPPDCWFLHPSQKLSGMRWLNSR